MSTVLPGTPAALKCACADLWAHPIAQLIVGPALPARRPALTNQILERLTLAPHTRVLDIGSGTGVTLGALRSYGVTAVGVDYSAALAAQARDVAPVAIGDGEALPFAAEAFDAVLTECVVSALPDKHTALAETRRVLTPGGTLVVTDMVVNGAFPEPLRSVAAWAACVGGACTTDEYTQLLGAHGFSLAWHHDATAGLADLVNQAQRRLAMLQGAMALDLITSADDVFGTTLTELGVPINADGIAQLANLVFAQLRAAIADGRLGYTAMIAR